MNYLLILTIGVFVLLLISFILSDYDFFSPSFIICLMFFVSSLFALYSFKAWDVSEGSISIEGILIILSGILIFIITEFFVKTIVNPHTSMKEAISNQRGIHPSKKRTVFILGLCLASTVLYCFFLYKYMRANGYLGGLNITKIAAAHHQLSFQDEKEGGIPRTVRILKNAEIAAMFVGMYIFLNNTVLCREKARKNIVFLLPAVVYLPISILSSSRSIYLQLAGSALLMLYIMLCRKSNWRKRQRNNFKIIKTASIVFISALALFYIASISGLIGRQTERTFLDYISVYIGAPIINFNLFLKDPPNAATEYFGQETFAGLNSILVKLGIHKYKYTVQLERRWINGINAGNVYTFFRRPYRDFGLIGMYITVILTAAIFEYIYYKKIYRKPQSYKTDKALVLYSYFFYIIYLFSILNQLCNLLAFSQLYFVISCDLIFAYLLGRLSFSNLRIKLRENK